MHHPDSFGDLRLDWKGPVGRLLTAFITLTGDSSNPDAKSICLLTSRFCESLARSARCQTGSVLKRAQDFGMPLKSNGPECPHRMLRAILFRLRRRLAWSKSRCHDLLRPVEMTVKKHPLLLRQTSSGASQKPTEV